MIFEPSEDQPKSSSTESSSDEQYESSLFERPEHRAPTQTTPTLNWEEETIHKPIIKVLGVGGGGCNAVQSMITQGFEGVQFYAINTDRQALERCRIPNRIQIGENLTQGSGAGALPSIGEQAAREAEQEIRDMLEGADMVFITAGMGGGTGTGAAPVIAEIARSMNVLNVAIITKPFHFEGTQRMRRAGEGMKKLAENVDTMITILNDKLMEVVGPKTPLTEAFEVANSVLAQGIRAISDLIALPGLINVDFRDVRTIMGETGGAVMGVGVGKGENRAVEAVRKACHSPLQEKIVIDGARGILINITGPQNITMHEINEATTMIYEMADPEANVIFGVVIDENMHDSMRVTIIATGFGEGEENEDFRGQAARLKPRSSPINIPTPQSSPADYGIDRPIQTTGAQREEAPRDESNMEPAILRKRKAQPGVDFGSQENPLKDWGSEENVAQAQSPQQSAQVAEQRAESGEAIRVETGNPEDREAGEGQGGEGEGHDPYWDTPALHRRRRNRFFE